MNIVFMGTPEFSVPILEGLVNAYNVSLVVTQPDKMVGRKKEITYSPIKNCAIEHGIEVFQPIRIKEDYKRILDANPDIIVTAAYGQMIPVEVLEYPKYKSINVHASLLPELRGGAPIHKAIIWGHEKTGVTIMYMVKKMDAGDIISQAETPIYDGDNLLTLTNRLSIMGANLLMDTLPLIFNEKIVGKKQDEGLVTIASNVSRDEEHLDFSKKAIEVFNHVRGLSPNPGAYTVINNQIVKIFSCTVVDGYQGERNSVVDNKKKLVIMTSDKAVQINELMVEGKKRINAKDFLNGQKIFNIGDILS